VLDNGTSPTNPLILADVVSADCQSTTDGGGSSTGGATLVGLTIGGNDVCTGLGLAPSSPCPNGAICCQPPANTDACAELGLTALCDGLGLSITLNEQSGAASGNPTDMTVNAIHVHLGDPVPPGNGIDLIVSSAHCDAAAVPATP
jgi:hypothetical protein